MSDTRNSSSRRTGSRYLLTTAFLATLALGIAAGWTLRKDASSNSSTTETSPPSRDRLQAVAAVPPSVTRSTNRQLPPSPSRPALSAAEQIAQDQAIFSTFESRFRTDTADASWAAPTERKLVEAASEPALTELGVPESYEASCSGHMCKLSLTFATRLQADDWASFYVTSLGDAISYARTMVSPRPDGRAALIIYGTRAGSEGLLATPAAPAAPSGAKAR